MAAKELPLWAPNTACTFVGVANEAVHLRVVTVEKKMNKLQGKVAIVWESLTKSQEPPCSWHRMIPGSSPVFELFADGGRGQV
ncbi:MAG TPA: hypothetical protein VII08_10250 [Myxococcales bacterium]